jgi:ABC-type lipoprotein export system ATPase subunit
MNITLHDVTKNYNLDEYTTITPIRNLSLSIEPDDIKIIIGRSGSGKTTLLNLAAGLVKPSSGEILVDGVSYNKMTDRQLSALRSRKIGFIFQFPSLLPSLTILENVIMPTNFSQNQDKQDFHKRAKDLLDLVGLTERMGVYPKQLSAGEQKRAVIARSLINRPEIILADEPTSDLDELTEKEIMALLREIHHSGVSFVIVTHSLQLLPYSTQAFKMEKSTLHELKHTTEITDKITSRGHRIYAGDG